MSDLWEIGGFQIETTTSDGFHNTLFANGLMQVAVLVKIKAYVHGTEKLYTLSQAELDTIKLIDYDDISAPLSPWAYSKDENEYDHTLPSAFGDTSDLEAEKPEPGVFADTAGSISNQNFQFQKYWVTTTQLGLKNLAASIKQRVDQRTVHTAGGGYNSHVTITGIVPRDYEKEDLDVEERVIGLYGHRNVFVKFKSRSDVLKKLEMSGYYDDPSQPSMKYCIYISAVDHPFRRPSLWFFCPMGPEKTITVGAKDALKDIRINQKENAFCISLVDFSSETNPWKEVRKWDSKFKLYDRFGNWNEFFIGVGVAVDRPPFYIARR
ncbi:hypothetical protein HDV63DRAFT_389469 [Trichoderma sp. SZMC 28014]